MITLRQFGGGVAALWVTFAVYPAATPITLVLLLCAIIVNIVIEHDILEL